MKWLQFIIVLGCTLLACDDQAVETGNRPVYLIPMASGNQWYYETDILDSLGAVVSVANEMVFIYGDTLIGGTIWYGFSGQGYRVNKPDGVWQLLPTPFLEFPVDVGDSVLQGNGVTYVRLISKAERVTVPAGTFLCFQFSETNPQAGNTLVNTYYVAPSLGLVKKELFDPGFQNPKSVIGLVVYDLK